MSLKEAERLGVMRQIDKEILTLRQASEQLGLSLRQVKRVRKRYKRMGAKGLISRKRGKPSSNKTPKKLRDKAIHLIKKNYVDFGPTLASEKLKERNQIELSVETVRKLMIEEGLWKSKRKKEGRVYQRRERRSRLGELLQGDGSPHDWLEGRGEKCTLLHFVDDATGITTAARFTPSETTEGYLEILKEHLERYGRPLALYVDKHRIFRVCNEELKKEIGITHFGKVVKDLEIELICANSPQAKGRIERRNGVMQDRLIKEMRLAKISSIEDANDFLPRFLEKFNKRFGKPAASPEDAHRPLRKQDDLKKLFMRRDQRRLSKDLTFQHHGILYMIDTNSPNRLKYANVEVRWREGEEVQVEYKGRTLTYKKWAERANERPEVLDAKEIGIGWASRKTPRRPRQHPWR